MGAACQRTLETPSLPAAEPPLCEEPANVRAQPALVCTKHPRHAGAAEDQRVGKVGTQAHLRFGLLAPTYILLCRGCEGSRTVSLLTRKKPLNAPNGSPGIRLRPAHPRAGAAILHHPQAWQRRCHPTRMDEGLSGVLQFFPPPLCKGLGLRL